MPIKTVSEANCSEHWTKKATRHKRQQWFCKLFFERYVKNIYLPCVVSMTRIGPRILDDDNLRFSLKWVRDEISECLIPEKRSTYLDKNGKLRHIKGRADDDPRIIWQYYQEKNKNYGVRIDICSDS